MPGVIDQFMRQQLLDRRHRLEHVAHGSEPDGRFHRLLEEVDAALAKVEEGSFGICDICHEPVETDRLIADPLVRICLDHLSRHERDALEKDLELAAQVQKGLLPACELVRYGWHACYHYEPAGMVSGDYCDLVEGGEAGLYFMVGDVSGKGVAASMLMAHLHAMFRTLISVGMPLKGMVEHASRVFAESTLPTHYATLIVGRAEPSGKVEICNAGHPFPLVMRDGEVGALEGSGLPVGMFCDEEFAVDEIQLKPGELLLLYSDGVPETMDSSGAEYGTNRLRQILGAHRDMNPYELIATCRADLHSFRCSSRKADDVTMLALRRALV